MEKNPLVTIFFLAHNYEKKIERAVQAIINQSYSNFEIIISDNQSTDNTQEVIRQIQNKNPNIVSRKNIPDINIDDFYDVNIKNASGATHRKPYDACLNHCNGCLNSGLAKGEFIIFCHQDDIYQKDIIKKEVDFLMAHPKVAGVFTLANIIDADGNIVGKWKLPQELKKKNVHYFDEIFKAVLRHGNTFLLPPTFMARKEIFEKVGLFDDHGPFGCSTDLEMWLRILESSPIGILQENLIHWRNGGRGAKYNQFRTEESDFFKVVDYYLTDKGYINKIDKKSLRQYKYQKDFDNTLRAMNLLIKGDINQAKKIINASFSWKHFGAFFENIKIVRIKVLALKIILYIGLNFGLGEYLRKMFLALKV